MLARWLLVVAMQAGAAGEARELWERGSRVEAIEVLTRAVEAQPQQADLRRQLVEAEFAVHRYAAALEHAQGLGPELDSLRGTALYRLGEFERSLQFLSNASERDLRMRIDAFEALGRFEESDRDLERLAKLVGAENGAVPVLRARSALRRNDLESAEVQFRRAVELDPCDPAAVFGLGQTLVKRGKREEGLKWLAEHRRLTPLVDQLDFAERAVDLAPMHAPNHAAVGDAERALGRTERAIAAYERAEKLAGDAELAPIVLRHARALAEDRHDLDAAVQLLDASFRRSHDARMAVRAGDLLLDAGRGAEALKCFEAASKVRANDPEIEKRIAAARERK